MSPDWAGEDRPEGQTDRTRSGNKGSGEECGKVSGLLSSAEREVNERRIG